MQPSIITLGWDSLTQRHLFRLFSVSLGFPSTLMVKHLPAMQETQVQSWVKKIPWRREWQPTPVFLPGEFHGQRSLAPTVHGVSESDMTERLTHTHSVSLIN